MIALKSEQEVLKLRREACTTKSEPMDEADLNGFFTGAQIGNKRRGKERRGEERRGEEERRGSNGLFRFYCVGECETIQT